MRYPSVPIRLNAPKRKPRGQQQAAALPAPEAPPVDYPPIPASAYPMAPPEAPALAAPLPDDAPLTTGVPIDWGMPGTWEHLHRIFVANVIRANREERSEDVPKLASAFLAASKAAFGGRKPTVAENTQVSQMFKAMGMWHLPTSDIPKIPRANARRMARENFFGPEAQATRDLERRLQQAHAQAQAEEPGVTHVWHQSGTRQYSPTLLRHYARLTSAMRSNRHY